MRHVYDIDYNSRDSTGNLLRKRVRVADGVHCGDTAVLYEPSEGTELDATVERIHYSLDTDSEWCLAFFRPHEWRVRDIHVCTTPCDSDCDDYCHEGHQVPWKREPGHPYPRIVNGVIEE